MMENFKITVTDFNGERQMVVAAHSKYQALEEVKTMGEAYVRCETTNEQGAAAVGTGVRISKKMANYLKQLDENDRH